MGYYLEHMALANASGVSKLDQFSPSELLSAAQAMSLFTLRLVIGSGTEHALANRETLKAMAVSLLLCPTRFKSSLLAVLQKIATRFDEARWGHGHSVRASGRAFRVA